MVAVPQIFPVLHTFAAVGSFAQKGKTNVRQNAWLFSCSGRMRTDFKSGRQGAPDSHPAPPQARAAVQRAAEVCRRRGADFSLVALRFCFDQPYISSTLVGMASREEVATNLRVLYQKSDLDVLQEIRGAVGRDVDAIWPSGRPENNG